jgi:AbiV family abortive infection protein
MVSLYEEAAKKSYENALDLQKDARLLYDKKRYARAYALSVLSIEELCKAYLFKGVAEGTIKEEKVKLLQKAIINHSIKLNMISLMLGISQLSSETTSYLNKADIGKDLPPPTFHEDVNKFLKVMEKFEEFGKAKLNALYVDINGSGVISPRSEMNKEKRRRSSIWQDI